MAGPLERAEAPPPLPAELARPLAELAQAQLSLEQLSGFYPPGHQGRLPPLRRLQAALAALFGEQGKIALGFAEDAVAWHGQLFGELPPPLARLADSFLSLGIAAVTWREGVAAEELQGFASLLVERRGEGRRRQWEETGEFPHIEAQAVDYAALVREGEECGDGGPRLDLWKAMLLRVLVDDQAVLTPEEDALLHAEWADPQQLADFIVEGLGEGGSAGTADAVTPVQRLAALLEGAAREGPEAERLRGLLADVGRLLPPPLRLRLLEATLDGGRGLFAEAFGTVPRGDVARLLAGNFALEPDRIMRLTRVFQHLVPRGGGRGEEAARLRDLLRAEEGGASGVPDNAWQEVEGLLTGEGGDFMSAAYRETLERLAAREALRGGAEASFTRLPSLVADLEPARTGGETLAIALESVGLATDEGQRAEALELLSSRARAALEGGRREEGVRIVERMLELEAGDGAAPAPAGLAEALRTVASEQALAGLLAAPPGDEASAGIAAALAERAPVVAAVPLVESWLRDEDAARRARSFVLLERLSAATVPAAVGRLAAADGVQARALAALLGELRAPESVPALAGLLARRDERVRREAARALARIDTPEARKALPPLLADEDEDVAGIAAAHLGAIGHQGSRRELIRVLERGSGAASRSGEVERAVFALGRMRAPEAVAPLAEVLRRRSLFNRKAQEALCLAAAQALRRIGTPEAKAALERAAASAPAHLAAAYRRLTAQWERP